MRSSVCFVSIFTANSIVALGPAYLVQKLLLPDADEAENALPKAFLEEFSTRFEGDGLEEIMRHISTGLSAHMAKQSLMKDYQTPIRVSVFTGLTWFKSNDFL